MVTSWPSWLRSRYPAASLALLFLGTFVAAAIVLLTPHTGRAAFPGSNGKIAFDSDRFGVEQIFVVASPGGDADQLTHDSRNYSPTWSPDGTRIAFVSDRDGKNQIYIMKANGSQQVALTSGSVGASAQAWSADGNKVAFIRLSAADSHYSIWTVDSGGGGSPVERINLPGEDTMPAFSPDGSRIAFAHADPNGDFDIYVANANGTNAAGITSSGGSDTWPDWSPDGGTIAYLCEPEANNREICLIDADGGNEHAITDNTTSSEYSPSWSPDETRIAFEADGPDGFGIYTMNPSGGDLQPFSVNGDEYEPDWQPLTTSPTPTPTNGPALIQGDVNCDGDVNEEDFTFMMQYLAGLNDGTQPEPCPDLGEAVPASVAFLWGDVDCQNGLNVLDALHVLAYKAGIGFAIAGCTPIGAPLT